MWQYDKADRLNSIIQNQQIFFDENVKAFWDDYRNNIFNLQTCDTFGLTVWGIILGVERPAYLDGSTLITFTDEGYRTLLRARIMLMDMKADMASINRYIAFLFEGRPVAVYDNLNMTISYYFGFELTDEEAALIAIDGVLPRPTGVEAIALTSEAQEIFGFSGQQLGQLDNSVFIEEPAITQGRVMCTEGVFINTGSAYMVWE